MIEILPAGSAAAALLAALHAEGFDAPWTEAEFAELLVTPGVTALMATPPVGFVLLRTAADEGEILTIVVLPAERRRGHGRALIEAAAAKARAAGAARLFLEVSEDNPAALALYGAAGFTRVGVRRGYYAGPGGASDAHVLRLEL